jgi:hypothetical protein
MRTGVSVWKKYSPHIVCTTRVWRN